MSEGCKRLFCKAFKKGFKKQNIPILKEKNSWKGSFGKKSEFEVDLQTWKDRWLKEKEKREQIES